MKKMFASDPDYPIFEELWRLYHIAKNPQCWVNENDINTKK